MKNLIAISAGVLIAGTAAFAQPMSSGRAKIWSSLPNNSVTVTDWYKQTVYDPSDNKIGEIMDVLVSPEGRTTALIVGVGGFLGAGEKDVAVPFSAVKDTMKDALKSAPGFKYDKEKTSWVPDAASK